MVEVAPRLFLLIVHVITKLVGRLGLGLPGYLETSAPAEEPPNLPNSLQGAWFLRVKAELAVIGSATSAQKECSRETRKPCADTQGLCCLVRGLLPKSHIV